MVMNINIDNNLRNCDATAFKDWKWKKFGGDLLYKRVRTTTCMVVPCINLWNSKKQN